MSSMLHLLLLLVTSSTALKVTNRTIQNESSLDMDEAQTTSDVAHLQSISKIRKASTGDVVQSQSTSKVRKTNFTLTEDSSEKEDDFLDCIASSVLPDAEDSSGNSQRRRRMRKNLKMKGWNIGMEMGRMVLTNTMSGVLAQIPGIDKVPFVGDILGLGPKDKTVAEAVDEITGHIDKAIQKQTEILQQDLGEIKQGIAGLSSQIDKQTTALKGLMGANTDKILTALTKSTQQVLGAIGAFREAAQNNHNKAIAVAQSNAFDDHHRTCMEFSSKITAKYSIYALLLADVNRLRQRTLSKISSSFPFRYLKFIVDKTGTDAHVCIEGMKISAAGKDHYPASAQFNGFSPSYSTANPTQQWPSGNSGHWCGWSTDGSGANIVLDMGQDTPADSYSFRVHSSICTNDPKKWTVQASIDGQSWSHLDTTEHDCHALDHAGGWNTFSFKDIGGSKNYKRDIALHTLREGEMLKNFLSTSGMGAVVDYTQFTDCIMPTTWTQGLVQKYVTSKTTLGQGSHFSSAERYSALQLTSDVVSTAWMTVDMQDLQLAIVDKVSPYSRMTYAQGVGHDLEAAFMAMRGTIHAAQPDIQFVQFDEIPNAIVIEYASTKDDTMAKCSQANPIPAEPAYGRNANEKDIAWTPGHQPNLPEPTFKSQYESFANDVVKTCYNDATCNEVVVYVTRRSLPGYDYMADLPFQFQTIQPKIVFGVIYNEAPKSFHCGRPILAPNNYPHMTSTWSRPKGVAYEYAAFLFLYK